MSYLKIVKRQPSRYGTEIWLSLGLSPTGRFEGFLVGANRLEDSNGYLATLTILVDRQQIPRQVLDSIGLDQNVSKRPTADQVRNTLDCENIDPLTRCLQLFHKLVQARNSKFLKGLVTRNI